MKSVFRTFLSGLFLMLISSSILAQQWNPPFKIEKDSLIFTFPHSELFNKYDSAFILIKVHFHEKENRIDWFDLIRVDLIQEDSASYQFFNKNIDYGLNAKKMSINSYPDSITISLVHYLGEKIKKKRFKPTKYVDEYRSVPIGMSIRLKRSAY